MTALVFAVAVLVWTASTGPRALAAEPVPAMGNERAAPAAKSPPAGGGLPLPRFVSLKTDKVHVRHGPGTDHRIAWVFQQPGLPVEVIEEFETWRRIRDSEGASGWVFQPMLSGRRTVLVQPWEGKEGGGAQTALRSSDSASAGIVALLEPGVLGNVKACDGKWCELQVGAHRGYIEQRKLWGVYDGEVVK